MEANHFLAGNGKKAVGIGLTKIVFGGKGQFADIRNGGDDSGGRYAGILVPLTVKGCVKRVFHLFFQTGSLYPLNFLP
jgi:hypothetical protein